MLCSETSVQLSTSEVNSGNLFSFSNIPVAKKNLLSLEPVHIKTSTSPSVPVLQCPQPVGGSGAVTTSFQQWLILPMKMSTRGKLIRRISTSYSGV